MYEISFLQNFHDLCGGAFKTLLNKQKNKTNSRTFIISFLKNKNNKYHELNLQQFLVFTWTKNKFCFLHPICWLFFRHVTQTGKLTYDVHYSFYLLLTRCWHVLSLAYVLLLQSLDFQLKLIVVGRFNFIKLMNYLIYVRYHWKNCIIPSAVSLRLTI